MRLFTFLPQAKRLTTGADMIHFSAHGMNEYVEMQKKVCELHGIPFLDQFFLGGYNIYNESLYYHDPIHMNALGYKKLGKLQVSFLAFP